MPPRRSSRVASASLEPASIESLPAKRKRGPTIEPDNGEKENVAKPASRTRAIKKARPSIDVVNGEEITLGEDKIEMKPKRGKRGSSMANPNQPALMDIDEEEPPIPSGTRPEAEEDEEKSLFDPPPMPGPSSLPQAVPEEPTGPKSRLVIHKMALINFKSYAGRQEIGPFHKVAKLDKFL